MNLMQQIRFFFFCIIIFFTLQGQSTASNYIFNGSFEINTVEDTPDGWYQYLGPKKIPSWFDRWKLDTAEAFHGNKSVKLAKEAGDPESIRLQRTVNRKFVLSKTKRKISCTLSMYMKASTQTPLSVRIAYNGKKYKIRVTDEWQRFSFAMNLSLVDLTQGNFSITLLSVGAVWIDAVQLEEGGSPSVFEESRLYDSFYAVPVSQSIQKIQTQGRKYLKKSPINSQLDMDASLDASLEDAEEQSVASEAEGLSQNCTNQKNDIKIHQENRSILVDGKPFFFFGATFMRAHLSMERWRESLSNLKSMGYTAVVASFSSRFNESRASIDEINRFLDLADEFDLKVVIWINPNAVRNQNNEFQKVRRLEYPLILKYFKEEMHRLMDNLKTHPALLAWYIFDEPDSGMIKAGITNDLVRSAKSIDQCHPVYINYHGSIVKEVEYNGIVAGDIVSMDFYPVPERSISQIAWRTRVAVGAGGNKKPMIFILQFFAGRGRLPTPQELSCMTYLSAINGATGFQTWPMMPASEIVWNSIKPIIKELKDIAPALCVPGEQVDVANDFIMVSARKTKTGLYILAVNYSSSAQEGEMTLTAYSQKKSVQVLFENRTVVCESNKIQDFFQPYERHVYFIPASI